MNIPYPPIALILLAGGVGSRIKSSIPKQYLSLKGRPIVQYSLALFLSIPAISEIIVVCKPEFQTFFQHSPLKPLKFASPGKERQNSVASGYSLLSPSCEYILIHDTARPLIQKNEVDTLLKEGLSIGAATLGVPMHCTIKEIDTEKMIQQTLDRNALIQIQTPQLLRRDILEKGLKEAKKRHLTLTDDVSLAELIGHPVKVVIGSHKNFKITTIEDLEVAKQLIHV